MKIKNLISVGVTFLMMMDMVCLNQTPYQEEVTEEVTKETTEEEVVVLQEKQEVHILTDAELSLLYSCHEEARHIDTSIVELSQEDAYLLMQMGRSEGGTGVYGQFWVMRSIYNRYEQGFGDSIWEIVNDGIQYEVVTSGKYLDADINENTHKALALLESGYNPTEGALYFESNTNSENSWHKKNLTFIKEVEGNLFYK